MYRFMNRIIKYIVFDERFKRFLRVIIIIYEFLEFIVGNMYFYCKYIKLGEVV